jgi:hypothetical protein
VLPSVLELCALAAPGLWGEQPGQPGSRLAADLTLGLGAPLVAAVV